MILYDRLWSTMSARGMTQYRLIKQHNFSAGQIGRLKKNMHVSTHTLDTLCAILDCGITDIIEYVPEEGRKAVLSSAGPSSQESGPPLQPDEGIPAGSALDEGATAADAPYEDAPILKNGNSPDLPPPAASKPKKPETAKNDKPKKTGKSKKGDKKSAKKGKDSKKGK